jgi:1,4-dihydroxy-2-naphthoate polyprenyltransferase
VTNSRVKAWIQASRVPFFVATLIPLILGGVVASKEGAWDGFRWFIVFLASFLVHLCTNLANDFFDHAAGADSGASIGGSRVIQEGKITPGEIRTALIVLYSLAFVCGLWILWVSQVWWLAGAMLFSFFSSLFYTAPPVRYGYLGLGELFVGLNMGPVMVVGTSAALAGRFISEALWLSIPVGVMVAMILYYQSLPDIDEDRRVGKQTISARFGNPAAIWGFRFFVVAALGSTVALVLWRILSPVALVSLLTAIPTFGIDRMIRNTKDWKDLHDRGGSVRLFYLTNGIILIVSTALG